MKASALLAFFLVFFFFSSPAFAYIDPGTGSMLAQIVLGAILGGVFWFRGRLAHLIMKIKSLFR